jgi:hypothetical protein
MAAAVPSWPSLTGANGKGPEAPQSALKEGFLNPPDSARPWVYGMVMDGNLTREGVTADLEALQRVGIRGLTYMEVDMFVPRGRYRFLSPEWREMLKHFMKEATRLGITLDFNNDSGYAGSGGPWSFPCRF